MIIATVKSWKWVENRLKKLYFDKIIPVGTNRLSQWMNDIIKTIGIRRLQVNLRPNPGV
jgi:predicted transcriptional regulator